MNKTGQTSIAGILIFLIVFSIAGNLMLPKKAQAMTVIDPAHIATNVAGWIKDVALWIKDYAVQLKDLAINAARWLWDQKNTALKIAMAKFRKILLDTIVNQIVAWIQGGGDPKFVTNWKGFLQDVADVAGGQVLEELLGEDLMRALCNPDWAIRINISLRTPQTFKQKVICKLSDIASNWNNFRDNFRNGGWKSWITVSESAGNPYGVYLTTLSEKLNKELEAQTASTNEARSGAGFLNDSVCKQAYSTDEEEIFIGTWKEQDLPSGYTCQVWETRTPGKIVADTLGFSVRKDMEWLITNEEWESYIVAITDALINRLVTDGVMAITSSDISGSGPSGVATSGLNDTEPAITTLTIYDPWHVQLTSNEDSLIYYTVDGSEPTVLSSNNYFGPIEIKSPTTLRWFSMDYWGNQEEKHSIELVVPFLTDQPEPATLAYAVGENTITFISSIPATIYYTLDGMGPTTASKKFMQKIELVEPITPVKWFAMTSQGIQESTQHELGLIPPFPNDEFFAITDFINPIAIASAPNSVSDGQGFALDPSGSHDPDDSDMIAMYEWDFDNDGLYDWWEADWNRDGIYDEARMRETGNPEDADYNPIRGGFSGMGIPENAPPGAIQVQYSGDGETINIRLRVTDNEGLYDILLLPVIIY
ncbi:MAG: chitobiase/beta-hexosaminidase C-terminal domain-containing protein [Patescibacteria group bacterium]